MIPIFTSSLSSIEKKKAPSLAHSTNHHKRTSFVFLAFLLYYKTSGSNKGNMNTPPTGVHDLPHAADIFARGLGENLSLRLEEVVASREEATPDPKFQSDDVEQCYQWICTELHKHFKPQEVEKLRTGINETDYWEREAQHYRDAANEKVWQSVLGAYDLDRGSTADGWRSVTKYYQGVLMENGLPSREVREVRLSIDTQRYWQYEAELFRLMSVLREHEIREHWKKRKAQQQCQTQSKQLARRPTRAQRSTAEPRHGGRVSDGTRSKTRGSSTRAGVAKRSLRSGKSGAKACPR